MHNEMTGKIIAMEHKKQYLKEKNRVKSNKLDFMIFIGFMVSVFTIVSIVGIYDMGFRRFSNGLEVFVFALVVLVIFGYFLFMWPSRYLKNWKKTRTRLTIFEKGFSPGYRPVEFAERKKHLFIPWSDVTEITNVSWLPNSPYRWVYRLKTRNAHKESITLSYGDFPKESTQKVREIILEIKKR